MLECQRHEFSLPDGLHYLNCAYMSPLPRRVEAAGIAGVQRKRVPSEIAPHHFFDDSQRARELFAGLINGEAERVAIVPAVSYGIALLARNASCTRGQNIVVSAEQFPSNVHAWRRLAARTGAQLRTVDAPQSDHRGEAWNTALLDAIDADTAAVALPQVHWTDGTRFDLERIGAAARRAGAALIIDATQSVGALPFDNCRIGADAVVCAAYKWLLGPYSIGAAWIGARFDDAEPLEETWIGRAASEDFRGLVNYRDDYQPGAARFDAGERSNFALMPMFIAGLELVSSWTPAAIQAYCRAITADALAEVSALGFEIEEPEWRASHLFGLRTPAGLDLAGLQTELQRRRISASLRGSALRVSPHVYNDAGDVAALLDALRAATGRLTSSAAALRTTP